MIALHQQKYQFLNREADNTNDLPAGSTLEDTAGKLKKQQKNPSIDRGDPPSDSITMSNLPEKLQIITKVHILR